MGGRLELQVGHNCMIELNIYVCVYVGVKWVNVSVQQQQATLKHIATASSILRVATASNINAKCINKQYEFMLQQHTT